LKQAKPAATPRGRQLADWQAIWFGRWSGLDVRGHPDVVLTVPKVSRIKVSRIKVSRIEERN